MRILYVCARASCLGGRVVCERNEDSCRRVKMQLPVPDRVADQVSCLRGEFMISKARLREIGEIFCLPGRAAARTRDPPARRRFPAVTV